MLLQIHEPGQTPDPHSTKDDAVAIGIDLGTTHSVVALSLHQQARTLPLLKGKVLVPSCVTYKEDQTFDVGHPTSDGVTIKSIKRLMGRGKEDIDPAQLPFEISPHFSSGPLRVDLKSHHLTPVEISSHILGFLKAQTETFLNTTVTHAVITVPAYFDEAARVATRDAARLAGLSVLRLLSEPTAAALAYGLDKNKQGIYAVYDLGGGTFDFSILRLEEGVFQVLATGGDTSLGGDDFDYALCKDYLTPETPSLQRAALLEAAKNAREHLSTEQTVTFNTKSLSRQDLEKTIAPLIDRTLAVCKDVLKSAGLRPDEIEGVVLVGGTTRTPAVIQAVQHFFGKPPLTDINPDQVVAYGAALQAEALTTGSDTLLLDVTPLSLGLETMGDIAEKLIYRNTPIPVTKKQEFTTFKDGQSGMIIHVLQGEFESASKCRSLAKFILSDIPPLPAGSARIEVTFTLDADGILSVSAVEKTTGQYQTIEIKPTHGLAPQEIRTLIEESMNHGGRDLEDRLLRAQKIEAERVLNALHGALEKDGDLLTLEDKNSLDRSRAELEVTLAQSDRTIIADAIKKLESQAQNFINSRIKRAVLQQEKNQSPIDVMVKNDHF